MSKVLFLNIPSHGHINPTLGIVSELIKNGEEVVYFCTEEFREKIEKAGAVFKSYGEVAKYLKRSDKEETIDSIFNYMKQLLESAEEFIEYILEQIKDIKIDYIGYSSMFPYGKMLQQILKVPSFSSFAIFATKEDFMSNNEFGKASQEVFEKHPATVTYKEIAIKFREKYDIEVPSIIDLSFNKGDINFAYTSKYFDWHDGYYDDSFKFIGPPIYDRKEDIDFPFEQLIGRKVIYISLGTVFSNFDRDLYNIFFKAFEDMDAAIVMTAYKVDTSGFNIPDNFIVRDYVPQMQILKFADAAITHAGMNTTNDLIFSGVPFVAIPFGADQPFMAARAEQLGAAISLKRDEVTPELLRESLNKVLADPSYVENVKKICQSFKETGGYEKAVEEIFKLKREKVY